MSGVLPMGIRAACVAADVANVMSSFNSQTGSCDEEDLVTQASRVNKLAMLGFTCMEIGAICWGTSKETLCVVKEVESMCRFVFDLPISFLMESQNKFSYNLNLSIEGYYCNKISVIFNIEY